MGFKDDIREKAQEFQDDLNALTDRVSQLERAVRNLRPAVERDITGTAIRRDRPVLSEAPAAASGVDYGAVAFGLADMRRKLSAHLPAHRVANEMRGAAEWFAAAFAGDPAFDRADFLAKAEG